HQSRSSYLIYVTKFVQVISCNLPLRKKSGADQVRPGISGLAQVNGRNNITDENKAAYDAKYASRLSMQLDVVLIIETLVSVIKRDGIFKDVIEKMEDKKTIN
ncbi:sugar transferase, partial [Leuconostoc lactis]